jgi:hypothetical protein
MYIYYFASLPAEVFGRLHFIPLNTERFLTVKYFPAIYAKIFSNFQGLQSNVNETLGHMTVKGTRTHDPLITVPRLYRLSCPATDTFYVLKSEHLLPMTDTVRYL